MFKVIAIVLFSYVSDSALSSAVTNLDQAFTMITQHQAMHSERKERF